MITCRFSPSEPTRPPGRVSQAPRNPGVSLRLGAPVRALRLACLSTAYGALLAASALGQSPERAAGEVRARLQARRWQEAVDLANAALAEQPDRVELLLARAAGHSGLGQHALALADYDRVLELEPGTIATFQQRGITQFKLGHPAQSVADFDRYLETRPDQAPSHWMRGISLYYAGRYADGRRQFEGYQTVDDADVENVVWRMLCQARETSFEAAREALLPVGPDRRVPMREIYELFAGRTTPETVLGAVDQGSPEAAERDVRQFYAELYVGLYLEAAGQAQRSLELITHAARDHQVDHYMWDVARVHVLLRTPPDNEVPSPRP